MMLFNGMISKYHYTFACTGLKVKERDFATRQAANKYMYDVCAKHGIRIVKIYDDKHNKTYICDNDVRFYIQRAW